MGKIRGRLEGRKTKKIEKSGAGGCQRDIQQGCCMGGRIRNMRKDRKKDRRKTGNNGKESVPQDKEP